MAENRYDWVVWDLTRPDSDGPTFGPMTEDQKNRMMADPRLQRWAEYIGPDREDQT